MIDAVIYNCGNKNVGHLSLTALNSPVPIKHYQQQKEMLQAYPLKPKKKKKKQRKYYPSPLLCYLSFSASTMTEEKGQVPNEGNGGFEETFGYHWTQNDDEVCFNFFPKSTLHYCSCYFSLAKNK